MFINEWTERFRGDHARAPLGDRIPKQRATKRGFPSEDQRRWFGGNRCSRTIEQIGDVRQPLSDDLVVRRVGIAQTVSRDGELGIGDEMFGERALERGEIWRAGIGRWFQVRGELM